MANVAYAAIGLTGGTTDYLDAIDGAILADNDICLVVAGGYIYVYKLNASSGATESSPGVISPDANAGTKRWILQAITSVAVGSDADGDMYYRASSKLARLAKGAANLKVFMNAGATAPEWAAGIFYKEITREMDAATGDVAYTGLGFKPALMFFFGLGPVNTEVSIGAGVPAYDFCVFQTAAGAWSYTGKCISLFEDVGKYQDATIKTADADGWTFTWTRTGVTAGGTATIGCFAIR